MYFCSMFKLLIRRILFWFRPETAHYLAAGLFAALLYVPGMRALVRWWFSPPTTTLKVSKKGLQFDSVVGLAAGFDKDAKLYRNFGLLGFGFIEVGTVTPRPQSGNPRPRLFRLPQDRVLINRMGFNNDGVDAMVERLKYRNGSLVIGGNIGKNKDTPAENAHEDYLICFEKLYDYVDYFAVNVSSPNTPGLRGLQQKEPLMRLLTTILDARSKKTKTKPVLLKISPDLNEDQVREIAEICKSTGIDGIIAANTTLSRDGLVSKSSLVEDCGSGGLSGWPLKARSNRIIRIAREVLGPEALIIGCGGVEHKDDAQEKLKAGADLVQVYTGFVYEGPSLIKRINNQLKLYAAHH
jgi:dihydroorotate dehydrogenase